MEAAMQTHHAGLRTRREELGWSRRELAAKSRVSPAMIEQIEGGYRNFSEVVAWKLAIALDTTPERLT
jgi:transcriptional regulator with XRE-family HTH domain